MTVSQYYSAAPSDEVAPQAYPPPARQRNSAIAVQIHELAHAFFELNLSGLSRLRGSLSAWRQRGSELERKLKEIEARIASIISEEVSASGRAAYAELTGPRSAFDSAAAALNAAHTRARLEVSGQLTEAADRQLLREYNEGLEILGRHQARVEQTLLAGSSPDTLERIRALWHESGRLQTALRAHREAHVLPPEMVEPYNELFADAFAVVQTGNPRAIAGAVGSPGSPASSRARDFSRPIPLRMLTHEPSGPLRIEVEVRNAYGRPVSYTDLHSRWGGDPRFANHNLLDAARAHFWTQHAQKPEWRRQPGRALRLLMDAIVREIDDRASDPSLRYLSPREINRRLIERIDSLFSVGAE